MRIYKNGEYVDYNPTSDELAQMEADARRAKLEEASRPLTDSEILRIDMRQRVNSLTIDNQTAGRMIDCFPTMREVCAEGELIPAKTRIRDDKDGSIIWRNNVDVWNTEANSPTNAPTLWDRIAYHEGIRIIPDEIPATLAWMKDELGWRDGHVYKSGMDGNVYLPGSVGALWEMLA